MSSNLTASASAISKSPVISELRGFLFSGAQLIHQQARTARSSFSGLTNSVHRRWEIKKFEHPELLTVGML
ncbi:hypothetical protein [Caballeronia sp. GACF4]|uniref:hypothetical protein n=1 Tax=Caballeronia sp. GACF4 TaxID=2921763 RepID=UPI002027E75C|nr:hypothetical protein [Caballeronia sp. GACF4]